jgi:probable phosphoglycerate mutase
MKKQYQIILYLVRHGETVLNFQKIIQGHSDSELTQKGKEQAQNLSKLLINTQIDEFYSSDLKRAISTAEILINNQSKIINTDKNLRERSYGRFEGKHVSELKILDDLFDQIETKQKLTFKAFPDVESDNEVALRIINFINNLYLKSNKNKTVLAVTHAGAIRSLLLYLGWATHDSLPHNAISNNSYIKLSVKNKKIEIIESFEIATQKVNN